VLALDQSTASILAQSNVSHLVDAICGRDANNIVKQRQCSQQSATQDIFVSCENFHGGARATKCASLTHQFLGCRFVAFCAHRSRLHCQARDSAYIPASGLPNLGQQWQRQEDCADKLPSSPASGRRAGAGAPSDAADRLGPMAPPSAISGSPCGSARSRLRPAALLTRPETHLPAAPPAMRLLSLRLGLRRTALGPNGN
jgi:hypothetical protein